MEDYSTESFKFVTRGLDKLVLNFKIHTAEQELAEEYMRIGISEWSSQWYLL